MVEEDATSEPLGSRFPDMAAACSRSITSLSLAFDNSCCNASALDGSARVLAADDPVAAEGWEVGPGLEQRACVHVCGLVEAEVVAASRGTPG